MSSKPSQASVVIRPATAADVPALCDLGARTFTETFSGMQYYTDEICAGYTGKAFTPDVIGAELRDPSVIAFVVEVDGTPAGYMKLLEREPPACLEGRHALNLQRIYFLKEYKGRGLGTRLLAEAHAVARRLGYDWLWLTVWEFNTGAWGFYEKHGFRRYGEYEWAFEADGKRYADIDWVMATEVKPQ